MKTETSTSRVRQLGLASACALIASSAVPADAAGGPVAQRTTRAAVATKATPAPAPKAAPAPFSPRTYEFDGVTTNAEGKVVDRHKGQSRYYAEDLGGGVTLEMASIPGGQFQMGSPDAEPDRNDNEGPVHTVKVAPFLLGKYEVTQAQWARVAALPKVAHDMNPSPALQKGDALPVNMVSWEDATEFCARLSSATGRRYRLPSEAEWEYACRAGSTTPFAFGPNVTPEIVNYDGNTPYGAAAAGLSRGQCVPVGSLGVANAFGLYDMHGNAWEWCGDMWHDSYGGAPTDGSTWGANEGTRKVLRGGSWKIFAAYCRSALRTGFAPDFRNDFVGFRVACDMP